jgi:hypothetical protein
MSDAAGESGDGIIDGSVDDCVTKSEIDGALEGIVVGQAGRETDGFVGCDEIDCGVDGMPEIEVDGIVESAFDGTVNMILDGATEGV